MKFLKAKPQTRIEETIPEHPLLHACCGEHGDFGDVTIDTDSCMNPMIISNVKRLPFKNSSFAAAYMDCPWTAAWKHNVSAAMKELLRVAPVVYVLSPWTYGSSLCRIDWLLVAWQPGVNQALVFARYTRPLIE